jgi:hypothetical protein
VCFALIVTNIWTTWSSGTWSKMMAGTVNDSSPNVSIAACSARSRCCPSMARRMPSRSGTLSVPTEAPSPAGSNFSFSSHEMMTAPGMEGRSRAARHCS